MSDEARIHPVTFGIGFFAMGLEIFINSVHQGQGPVEVVVFLQRSFLVYWGLDGEAMDTAWEHFIRLLDDPDHRDILQRYHEAARAFARSTRARARLWLLHAWALAFAIHRSETGSLYNLPYRMHLLLQNIRDYFGFSEDEVVAIVGQSAILSVTLMMLREKR